MRLAIVLLCAALLTAGCGTAAPAGSGAWMDPSPSAAPPVSSAPASPSPSVSGSKTPTIPAGVTAGIAVFDRQTGTFTEQVHVTTRFRSASLVKLLIALDYLWNRGPGYTVPAADRPRLDIMLRSSDDNAASYFWKADGADQIVTRMVTRLSLKDTAPPSAVGKTGWGSTTLSAADLVRVYRYLLDTAPAPVRDHVLGNLHQSTKCGTDRYDQSFGIPSAFSRPWAAKQGWYGFGDTPATPCAGPIPSPATGAAGPPTNVAPAGILTGAVLHTTGTVGAGDRCIVVVLTQHPEGTPFAKAAVVLTGLVRTLRVPGAVPA
jgi:hypothetical protein